MTKQLIVTVGRIDMDGYCGRDKHPEDDMTGCTGRVLKIETIDDENDNNASASGESYQVYTVELFDARPGSPYDGELVELIDHEIAGVALVDAM